MSIAIDPPHLDMADLRSGSARAILQKALLACGVLYSLFYVVVNDLVAATLYRGYSRFSQAVSELSATGAPTRALLTAVLPLFAGLLMAFGIGVWRASPGRRWLRLTGAVLVIHAASAPLWLLFPMTSRVEMQRGATMPANDIGHIALTALTLLLILLQMFGGAAALGRRRFRVYTTLSAAAVVGFGALTGVLSVKIPLGEPTPWLGLVERLGMGAWFLWLAVLAMALLRRGHVAPAGAEASRGRR